MSESNDWFRDTAGEPISETQRSSKKIVVLALLALAGCARGPAEDAKETKRGLLRHEYFVECMKLLPAGPVQTQYNDWDEVVDSCSNQAYYQSNQVVP